ncbi:class I ribonucleotide reductase maintenance protein YfaE [Shewanella subflava]|uniref:Class I ribonucleotide reductase maintenance protein YfaE n=1 Tax=Shewanella subflava TaxID=2986476 RepID=A0ABT3ICM7_9GAMM|nr:class I ribonucleotide reductase maintenance protein YfaE [Shewanella subflava]MCW3173705.1 class I ribonucleotide reductase maintenance protein YfaE [Shewanella subflava]
MTYKHFFIKAPIVSLKGQPAILFDGKKATLLEALEYKKVKVFSECRNGFCGACKTEVISGEVTYIKEPLAELKANECLPCCCIPQTDLNLALSMENVELVVRSKSINKKTLTQSKDAIELAYNIETATAQQS